MAGKPRTRGTMLFSIAAVIAVIVAVIVILSLALRSREFRSPARRSDRRAGGLLEENFDPNMEKVPLDEAIRAVKKEVEKLRDPVAVLAHQLAAGGDEGGNLGSATQRPRSAQERLVFHDQWKNADGRADTIFLGIISRNPTQCQETLRSLFQNATTPSKVHVAVIDYNAKLAEEAAAGMPDVNKSLPMTSCIHEDFTKCDVMSPFCPSDQIISRIIHASADEGDIKALPLLQKLYRNQDFVMLVANGVRFAHGWDAELGRLYRKIKATHVSNPILSFDPVAPKPGAGTVKNSGDTQAFKLCKLAPAEAGIPGVLEADSLASATDVKNEAVPQFFVSTSFLFAPGTLFVRVHFDEHLRFLSKSQLDFATSALSWISGFDSFAPLVTSGITLSVSEPTAGIPQFNESVQSGPESRRSRMVVKQLMGIPFDSEEAKVTGSALDSIKAVVTQLVGSPKRSLKQYQHVIAFDSKSLSTSKDLCGITKEYK